MSVVRSKNILDLARALDPDAFRPKPSWRQDTAAAQAEALRLIESHNPADHLHAAMMLTFSHP